MKNDKTRLKLMVFLTIAVFITTVLYGYSSVNKNMANTASLLPIIITFAIAVFMIFFIARRYQDIKQGQPLEDERSKKVMTKAAATSFYFTLYWLLFISFFEDFFSDQLFKAEHLDASQTVGGGIAGMAIAWIVCWLYYNKKGKLI